MAYTTGWMIGSVKDLDVDVTIDASLENVSGSLYLYHATDALSLLAQFEAAALSAGVTVTAVILRNRKVKISAAGVFTVTWGSDTTLRDLLGFSQGNLAGAATYTAADISPLLWSPAKPISPELSPQGTTGIKRPLAYFSMSPSDGSAFVVSHGTRTDQRWSAMYVAIDRVMTSDAGEGGEFVRFFNECLSKGFQFYVFRNVVEDDASSVTASLSGGLGPYVMVPDSRAAAWNYRRSRGREWVDTRADVVFGCRDASEYG